VYNLQVTVSDAAGQTVTSTVQVTGYSTILGHQLFYAGSSFDGTSHDTAIAPDKSPLLPGQTATFANYSSFSRGINGIMVDILRPSGNLTAADFIFRVGNDNNPSTWSTAPAPLSVTNHPIGGTAGTRIEIIWPDNAIHGQWLQVTLKGGAASTSGLAADDVFYFGSAPGEIGDDPASARVNAMDQLALRYASGGDASLSSRNDVNRDGVVGVADEQVARANTTYFLNELHLISVPGGEAAAPSFAQPAAPLIARKSAACAGTSGAGGLADRKCGAFRSRPHRQMLNRHSGPWSPFWHGANLRSARACW